MARTANSVEHIWDELREKYVHNQAFDNGRWKHTR